MFICMVQEKSPLVAMFLPCVKCFSFYIQHLQKLMILNSIYTNLHIIKDV